MGAFRQKSGMHPFFLSEPYETISLRKKINILKEKKYFPLRKKYILLKETFNCRIICKRFVMSVKGDSLKTLGVNRGGFKMSKNNKALQVKTCKAYVMRFKMGLNQRPPD